MIVAIKMMSLKRMPGFMAICPPTAVFLQIRKNDTLNFTICQNFLWMTWVVNELPVLVNDLPLPELDGRCNRQNPA
jgi:hypothetical protein